MSRNLKMSYRFSTTFHNETHYIGGSKNFTRNSRIVTKEHQDHYLNDPMNNIPTDVHYFDTQGFRVIISQRFFFIHERYRVWKKWKRRKFRYFLSLSLFFFLYERYNIACFNFLVLAVFFVEQSWFSLFVINAVSHFVMLAIFKKKKNEISIFFFFVTKRYIYLRVDKKRLSREINHLYLLCISCTYFLYIISILLKSIINFKGRNLDSNRSFRTSPPYQCVCVCVFSI